MFPLGNAARATRWVSLGIGAISCGWSDIAILLGSKDGDQTPSLQTLLASGLCEITLRCLMMPHEIGIGPRLMSCKSEFASSIIAGRPGWSPSKRDVKHHGQQQTHRTCLIASPGRDQDGHAQDFAQVWALAAEPIIPMPGAIRPDCAVGSTATSHPT